MKMKMNLVNYSTQLLEVIVNCKNKKFLIQSFKSELYFESLSRHSGG